MLFFGLPLEFTSLLSFLDDGQRSRLSMGLVSSAPNLKPKFPITVSVRAANYPSFVSSAQFAIHSSTCEVKTTSRTFWVKLGKTPRFFKFFGCFSKQKLLSKEILGCFLLIWQVFFWDCNVFTCWVRPIYILIFLVPFFFSELIVLSCFFCPFQWILLIIVILVL